MSALDIKTHFEAIRERQPYRGSAAITVPPLDYGISVVSWARLEDMPGILLRGKLSVSLDIWGVTFYSLSLVVRDNGLPAVGFPKRPILVDGVRGMGNIARFHTAQIRRAFSAACLVALLDAHPELQTLLTPSPGPTHAC
jgi:hypothetical protein